MDIEIRNGYRLDVRRSRANEHSFESIKEVLDAFKQQARPIVQTLVNKRAAYLCARLIDQRTLDMRKTPIDGTVTPDNWSPLAGAVSILLDRYGKACDTHRPDPHYALDAHVTIIPAGGEVLAVLWTEQPALTEVWEAAEGIAPFPYWTTTDRPNEVSEEEWAMRESIWLDACGDAVWAVAGFTTEVIGRWELPVPYIDGVMAYLPSLRDRSLLYAMDRVLGRRYKKVRPIKADSLQRAMAFDDALKWVKGTREGNAELQVEREEIEDVLPAISALMLVHEETPAELPR